jgi:lipoate-protein ligase B
MALNLGMLPYTRALALQRGLAEQRMKGNVPDLLLLLQHPPTITFGKNRDRSNLLVPEAVLEEKGIECPNVERGGDVTYHGPGQVIGYPILNLTTFSLGIRRYMEAIENVLIKTLAGFEISAFTRPGLTGVWVGEDKIASIGVRIRRCVTWHGFALNVSDETNFFRLITPCGLKGVQMTSMAKVRGVEIIRALLCAFAEVFDIGTVHLALLGGTCPGAAPDE